MSYETTADRSLDNARSAVADLVRHLAKIVVEQVDGHDEYSDDMAAAIERSFHDALAIRDRLNGRG